MSAADYLSAVAEIRHPYIEWPIKAPPKKKDDAPSDAPNPRCVENTAALIDAYGIKCRWNLMRHALELEIPCFAVPTERSENANLARILELAARRGLNKEATLDHLLILARDYHPVADWIGSAPWDGQDRIEPLIQTVNLASGSDPALAWTVIRKWLISCARAVLPSDPSQPPFTPQGCLTFQGPQGIGKTNWIKSLAPANSGWIAVGRVIDPHNRDSVQQATSFWIVELGELDATYKRADIAAIKAWVIQDTDTYRSAYARREENTPRRTVLAASVNPRYFLVDDTGNRRWWTLAVESLNWQHGIDMQQLWAQVAQIARQPNAQWWLTEAENAQLAASNAGHEVGDPLADDLWACWEPCLQPVSTRVTLGDIWAALPGRGAKGRTKAEATALANALRGAGVENEGLLNGCKTYRVRRIAAEQPTKAYRSGHWHD